MNTPIIIGGNHHNTLGVIRALGYRGIESIVILVTEDTDPYVAYSKYIQQCVIFKTKQEIVPFLIKYAKKGNEKSVILSCADFVTSELDLYYDTLKDHYYIPTAKKQGVCNHFMNKDTMANLAQNTGIKIPKSWIVEDNTEINVNEVDFPCIIKPLASILGSKAEIKIFHDRESLASYLIENKGHRFIIQKYIDKDFE